MVSRSYKLIGTMATDGRTDGGGWGWGVDVRGHAGSFSFDPAGRMPARRAPRARWLIYYVQIKSGEIQDFN